jgi:hypothetical protein
MASRTLSKVRISCADTSHDQSLLQTLRGLLRTSDCQEKSVGTVWWSLIVSYRLICPLAVQSFKNLCVLYDRCPCFLLCALLCLSLPHSSCKSFCASSNHLSMCHVTFILRSKIFFIHPCLINSNHMPQPLWQFCSNVYKIRGFI